MNFLIFLNKKSLYLILLVLFLLLINIIMADTIYCIDEETEKALSEAKNAAKNVNGSLNVNNPNINLGNPNVNVPGEAFVNLGIGGAVSAGIYSMMKSKKIGALPTSGKAATIFAGGVAGGAAFAFSKAVNSVAQNKINKSSGDNGPFTSANSMLEYSDTKESVMNILHINICFNIFVLLLGIFLLYMIIKKSYRYTYLLSILIYIISICSLYISSNILEDIAKISYICLKSSGKITNSMNLYQNNDFNEIYIILNSIFIFNGVIAILAIAFLGLYINNIIVNNNIEFKNIKNLLGTYYKYFNMMVHFTSKSNYMWMVIISIQIILWSIFATLGGLFLIYYLDVISELFFNI